MDIKNENVELSELAEANVACELHMKEMLQDTSYCETSYPTSAQNQDKMERERETEVSGQDEETSATASKKFRIVTFILLGLAIVTIMVLISVIVEDINSMKDIMEIQQFNSTTKYNSEVQKFKAIIKTQHLNFTNQISDVKTLNDIIESQKSNLSAQASEIKTMEDIIESQQSNLTALASDIRIIEDIIKSQQSNLTDRSLEIKTLKDIIASQQSNLTSQASEIRILNKIIESQQSNLTAQTSEIKILNKIIKNQRTNSTYQMSDTHECRANTDKCHINATYMCTCNNGFQGNGFNCSDTNECGSVSACSHISHSVCSNSFGSYTCECEEGYMMNEGENSCIDINECASGDPCSSVANSICDNAEGGFCCDCMNSPGITLYERTCRARICYMNFNETVFWFVLRGVGTTTKRMAENDCKEGGGSLAIFHSINQMHIVHEYLRSQGFTGGNRVWTGMRAKDGVSKVFVLSDGTKITQARRRNEFADHIATGNIQDDPSLLVLPQATNLYGTFCEANKTAEFQ